MDEPLAVRLATAVTGLSAASLPADVIAITKELITDQLGVQLNAIHQSQRRLLLIDDAEPGDAEQHDAPAELGGVKFRIKHIGCREVSEFRGREVHDRPATPVSRRNSVTGDDMLDALAVGADHQ